MPLSAAKIRRSKRQNKKSFVVYYKYLTELGCPEINLLFCDNDVYSYGDLPGLRFIRTKTIGSGGDLCDFKLVIDKK